MVTLYGLLVHCVHAGRTERNTFLFLQYSVQILENRCRNISHKGIVGIYRVYIGLFLASWLIYQSKTRLLSDLRWFDGFCGVSLVLQSLVASALYDAVRFSFEREE
jgi:hypothetical protein